MEIPTGLALTALMVKHQQPFQSQHLAELVEAAQADF
jgi:hypothetical protein